MVQSIRFPILKLKIHKKYFIGVIWLCRLPRELSEVYQVKSFLFNMAISRLPRR